MVVLAADQTHLPLWVAEVDALLAALPPTPKHRGAAVKAVSIDRIAETA